ncbi:exo-alpha-sialidase [Trypanosoma cruzi]|nr:exo-alpha-sialidase [Trypanosoma cruzi]
MAQKHIQCAAAARGQARQTVTDGEFKRIRREGPIHITATRGHASTRCADSTGDRSTCDSDSVMDERIFLLPRHSTNAVPRVLRHGRSQRAGTRCLHASRHHRPGLERAPSSFARTTSSMEKLRQRA